MGVLTLVRHGQGSLFAESYDQLSAIGRDQSRRLGEFWVRRQVDFDEVYCGPRARQRQTAEIIGSIYAEAGRPWPEVKELTELDEYDLDGLLDEVAPELARQDAAFAKLLASGQRNEHSPDRDRDFKEAFEVLANHWSTMPGAVDGVETFPAFRDRVERGLQFVMEKQESGRRVALFTSAGVIGAAVRLALAAPDRMALDVHWRVLNGSLTEFVFTKDRITLDNFNATPHLEDTAHWTYW